MVTRLVVLLLLALPAFGKSLHWKSIDVQARLDADGRLHVVERQQMVFDGDWNGGERNFNLRPHQTLDVHRITRIENGQETVLERGGLDAVDRYDFASSDVVRWRSRLPNDPPFANRELTYVLDYTYGNILDVEGGTQYRLSHDFGLPEREGVVERFTLNVEFDPAWSTTPIRITRENLQPGDGVAVAHALTFAGAGWPAGVRKPPQRWPGFVVLLAFASAVWLLFRAFVRHESAKNRFAAPVPQFDPELLKLRPELAGAVWDAGVGAPEVSATLARMAQEGKITTRVEGSTMHIHLNVARSGLHGYEVALVDALFVKGGNDTDTELVRQHYKSSGFDPARVIRPPIEAELGQMIPGWGTKADLPKGQLTMMMIAAFLVVGFAALLSATEVAGGAIMMGFVLGGISAISALFQRRKIAAIPQVLVVPAILLGLPSLSFAAACLQRHLEPVNPFALAAVGLWLLAWMRLTLEVLKIPDPQQVIAYRRRIAGARQFFVQELQKPDPAIRDEWFPYLLAFGLGPHVDHWFRGFGAARASTSSSSWSSSSSGSSSSSSSGWTGGGGAFGGAGATGSWALAAGAMAAGVAAPSSSSSGGGGGGGGGSSSGGGGGGGW